LGLFSLEKRRLQGDLVLSFQYLKGAYRKDEEGFFIRESSNRTRDNGFKLKESRFRYKEEILYYEGSEALAQAAQRSCGCPLPRSVQGQVGWGFEQPGLVKGVPAHGRRVGTRWSLRSLPT